MPNRFRVSVAPLLLTAVLLAAGCAASRCPERQLVNVMEAKQAVMAYHQDGRYEADVACVADELRGYVAQRLAHNPPAKPAVVFDIDQTLLNFYDLEVAMQFGYSPDMWDANLKRADLPAIAPTVRLYRELRDQGVALFLITGRDETMRPYTEANLRAVGVEGWVNLYLNPTDAPKGQTRQQYKTALRQDIEARGYTILASIGDQWSDIQGGFLERGFKLPNYMWTKP